jgi:hypothetical protein
MSHRPMPKLLSEAFAADDDTVVDQTGPGDLAGPDDPDDADSSEDPGPDEVAEEGMPPARGSFSKVTGVLMIAVLLAASFGGGVLIQKQHDSGLTAAPAGGAAAFAGLGGGLAGRPGGAGGAGAAGGAGGTGAATSTSPAVIGTVVSIKGSEITVKDFAGKTHVVHTTGTTTVSVPGSITGLKAGSTVSVVGASDAGGGVAATSVTQR